MTDRCGFCLEPDADCEARRRFARACCPECDHQDPHPMNVTTDPERTHR